MTRKMQISIVNGLLYQAMITHQRKRHKANSYEWSNHPENRPAVSRYPNILAELDASGWWIDRIAEHAGVSQAIIESVMEDNGDLSFEEFHGLACCFGCEIGYLLSPVLSTIDSCTNKGKRLTQRLKELDRRTEGMDGTSRFLYEMKCKDVLPAMENGKTVTYAAYRWACIHLLRELERNFAEEAQQRRTRTRELKHEPNSANNQTPLREQIRKARERDYAKKVKTRMAEIREYAESVTMEGVEAITTFDLRLLMEFSKDDLAGSLLLAIMYGRAMGYRTAKAEVM